MASGWVREDSLSRRVRGQTIHAFCNEVAQTWHRKQALAHLKLTLVLNSGARIGSGKAALLESIRATGSIAAAARTMGMDYKRAWLLIDSLNRAFDTPIVKRSAGGPGGGCSGQQL